MSSKDTNLTINNNIQENSLHTYENVNEIELEVRDGESYEYKTTNNEDEYVVHTTENDCLDTSKVLCNQNKKKGLLTDKKNITDANRYGHDNVYLQQIPNLSKCKVQFSVEGLYEDEGGEMLQEPSQQLIHIINKDTEGFFSMPCQRLSNFWTVMLGIIGLCFVIVITGITVPSITKSTGNSLGGYCNINPRKN